MNLFRTASKKDSADVISVYAAETLDGEAAVTIEIENNNWPSWSMIGLNKEQALELADVLVRRFTDA